MPTVRQATPDELPAVGAALAAVFADDATRWSSGRGARAGSRL